MKKYIFILMIFLLNFGAECQNLPIVMDGAEIVKSDFSGLSFVLNTGNLSQHEQNRAEGTFIRLSVPGFTTIMEPGMPALPVYSTLIEIPVGAKPKVQTKYAEFDSFVVNAPVMPYQPSLSKSEDSVATAFSYNEKAYSSNGFLDQGTAEVEVLGILRDRVIARVSVCPFVYNPQSGEIRQYKRISVSVSFDGGDLEATKALKKGKGNENVAMGMNAIVSPLMLPGAPLPESVPITYVIVADRMFEAQLAPFIQWKEQKGYAVIVGYTDEIGASTTAIKLWLSGLYNTPAAGYSTPSYLLIVGDIGQVPPWSGTTGYLKTDLYYGEYTGDFLPDLSYGRFSANTTAQLQPQIDKTLEYEQYQFPDATFLDEVVMVAGADASHQATYGNGQINYGTDNYFNAAHGLYSNTYLQPEPSGADYSSSIRQNVSDGVAYANYTAHCSSSGWSNPSFSSSHVAALQNSGKYSLMVGNCCQSAKFEVTCFGEVLLREPNKGALGYIGGSADTYWDEDYYWGVGVEPIVANPQFHADNLGAYDRRFHDMPGVGRQDWCIPQGQMCVAGNLAVAQSGSSRTNYYWEIYHLLGDPSLVVWLSQPDSLPLSYQGIEPGAISLTVTSVSDVLISVTHNNQQIGVGVVDSDGVINVAVTPLIEGDTLLITATHYDYQPYIDTVIVESAAVQQVLYLEEGWNGISTYLDLSDNVTANILQPLSDTLIIMKNMTQAFWPPYANNIPVWDNNSGYQIKVTDACVLILSGTLCSNKTVLLSEGWNLVGVKSEMATDVLTLFASVMDYVVIVKSTDGSGVFWPAVSINTLGNLQPGRAYLVYVTAACEISF